MGSLYNALSAEDRDKVDKWVHLRKNPQYEQDIPAEYYLAAELGYFYGWGAVEAYLRGYIANRNAKGKRDDFAFTFDDAIGLVEAAKKVHYLYEGKTIKRI